jgi:aryl-alcohol dehydrogenase-like predicted oxidoreductase
MIETILSLRRLGKSDLMVSPIGLGCWQFSRGRGLGGHYWPDLADEEITGIVEASLGRGINWFDTAESYGGGESEKSLAQALKRLGKAPGDIIIATKWRPVFRTAKSIAKTIDERLEILANYPIDLYQIHNPLSFSSIEKQIKSMAELVKKHKIRYIGVSNFSAKQMKISHDLLREEGMPLVSNQVRFSLLDRKIEQNGILETARELGISIIAYSPLAQGLLSGKFHDDPKLIQNRVGYRKYMGAFRQKGLDQTRPVIVALREVAQKHNVTLSQVALSWVTNSRGEAVVAIPGATHVSQAKENAESMKIQLAKDELDYLDKISSSFKT